MAISTVTNRVGYQGDGTSAVFAFPYRFHALTDLSVFVYNSSVTVGSVIRPQTLNTNYTISATANAAGVYPNGGSIIFNSTPSAQAVVVIFRSSAITNGFTVGQNGAIPSVGLNNEIDYLTMIAQRYQDQATRSVRLPDGFHGTFDTSLPPILSPNTVPIINSSATGFAVGPTASAIAGANSSAIAAAASEAAAATSASNAAASAVQAASAAVSCGISVVLVNSAVTSVGNAVALIGSTAYWGAESASSALSAFNSQVLANSAAVSAGNLVVLANSAAVSAGAQAVLAGSAALSASNSAADVATIVAPASVSANYTVLTSDRTILANSSNYTIRLFSTSGNAGREVTLIKTGSSVAGITIAGSGAALIAGLSSVSLDLKDESYSLTSDGVNWGIKSWVKAARPIAITIGSSSANMTNGGSWFPDKDIAGNWRIRFGGNVNCASLGTIAIVVGTGVISFDVSKGNQACDAWPTSASGTTNYAGTNGTGTLNFAFTVSVTTFSISGELPLAHRPLMAL